MHVRYSCPSCQSIERADLPTPDGQLSCSHCHWRRPVPGEDISGNVPRHCLICGCNDLWRQKDFPQKLGLTFVVIGATLSTIAWAYYMPVVALGILMAFALADMLLYTWMADVLVCYRCGTRYTKFAPEAETPYFNLETAERYRQEAKRLDEAQSGPAH